MTPYEVVQSFVAVIDDRIAPAIVDNPTMFTSMLDGYARGLVNLGRIDDAIADSASLNGRDWAVFIVKDKQ